MSVLDTLNGATANRSSVTICLNGAAQAAYDAHLAKLDQAVVDDAKYGSMAAERTTELLEQMEELRDQVAASEVTFEFEAMDWTARLNLQAEHPPRPGNFVDLARGFNAITFGRVLVRRSCIGVTDANGDRETEIPEATWTRLLGHGEEGDEDYVRGALNANAVQKLVNTATGVNDSETRIPPSARSLLESQDSGASLAQPDPGTSPRSGSEAGSRPGSPSGSTSPTSSTPSDDSSPEDGPSEP